MPLLSLVTEMTLSRDSRVYIAGHRGLVGSAIVRRLEADGYTNLIVRSRADLDLTRQEQVDAFFAAERPEYVVLAAAKVGGILANNTYRGDFIRENLQIATNVIDAAWRNGTHKLVNLSSSCTYPRESPQPMREEYVMTGPLEPTNEPYAMAKLAAMSMCRAYHDQYGVEFVSAIPTNLYGPGDNYDLQGSHFLPAIIRKCHEAKVAGASTVTVLGTGRPRREYLYSDDCADALVRILESYPGPGPINVGTGEDATIAAMARTVASVIGFEGDLVFDPTKPDGMPQKLQDISRLRQLGWAPRVLLEDGVRMTYDAYVAGLAAAAL